MAGFFRQIGVVHGASQKDGLSHAYQACPSAYKVLSLGDDNP